MSAANCVIEGPGARDRGRRRLGAVRLRLTAPYEVGFCENGYDGVIDRIVANPGTPRFSSQQEMDYSPFRSVEMRGAFARPYRNSATRSGDASQWMRMPLDIASVIVAATTQTQSNKREKS